MNIFTCVLFQFFMRYGPDYELPITPGNRKNMNSRESLQRIHNTIIGTVL